MTEKPNSQQDDSSKQPDEDGQKSEQGPVPTAPENASDTGPTGEDVAANPKPSPEGAPE